MRTPCAPHHVVRPASILPHAELQLLPKESRSKLKLFESQKMFRDCGRRLERCSESQCSPHDIQSNSHIASILQRQCCRTASALDSRCFPNCAPSNGKTLEVPGILPQRLQNRRSVLLVALTNFLVLGDAKLVAGGQAAQCHPARNSAGAELPDSLLFAALDEFQQQKPFPAKRNCFVLILERFLAFRWQSVRPSSLVF